MIYYCIVAYVFFGLAYAIASVATFSVEFSDSDYGKKDPVWLTWIAVALIAATWWFWLALNIMIAVKSRRK